MYGSDWLGSTKSLLAAASGAGQLTKSGGDCGENVRIFRTEPPLISETDDDLHVLDAILQ